MCVHERMCSLWIVSSPTPENNKSIARVWKIPKQTKFLSSNQFSKKVIEIKWKTNALSSYYQVSPKFE